MSAKPKIPRIPHAFFRWYCRPGMYEELHGDLEEFFYERVEEKGLFIARLLYLWDVIRCFQPYAWKESAEYGKSGAGLIKNYYVTAVRNLVRHRHYFLINISGLAIGIACIAFVSLYVINELSYDRFHTNFSRTYRVVNEAVINGNTNKAAVTNVPLTRVLLQEFPEVTRAARLVKSPSLLIGNGARKINEEGVLLADSSFFDVFDFHLLQGNPKTALLHPRSMVLSQSYARKYFGDDDPMGRQLTVEEDTTFYTVTGIVEDVPANSHIQFNMVGSISTHDYLNSNRWIGNGVYAYIVLNEQADPKLLEEKMQRIFYEHVAPEVEYYTGMSIEEWEETGNHSRFRLLPMADIHLRSDYSPELEPTGNISYLYIYSITGIIILCIAIFNYINMATAQSASRSREVGIRKVMGSTQRGLVFQFLVESMLVAVTAAVIAGALVGLLMPLFTDLAGKELAVGVLSGYEGPLLLLGLSLVVGILAGIYPAFVLAAFKPANALGRQARERSGWLRSLLVTAQFAASIVMIIGTVVVYDQVNFMVTKNLGFVKDQVLVIRRTDVLGDKLQVFKNNLLTHASVNSVAYSKTIPGKDYLMRSYRPVDLSETFLFSSNLVDYDYHSVLDLQMASGRFFSREYRADSNAVVINEAAARALGFDDPVGRKLTSPWHMGELLTIIGVVKDYNTRSLHQEIQPVALELAPGNPGGYITVRLGSGHDVRETVAAVDALWSSLLPGRPFQAFFFDEDYESLYRSEYATGQMFLVLAAVSVFISCLGLIGLITYTASVRRKEIGIRKVLGAGLGSLIKLLSAGFVRLMVAGTLLSWPLAYFASNYWLQNFAERITVNPWVFAGATALVVAIGGVAISFQTIRASQANPIEALRQE